MILLYPRLAFSVWDRWYVVVANHWPTTSLMPWTPKIIWKLRGNKSVAQLWLEDLVPFSLLDLSGLINSGPVRMSFMYGWTAAFVFISYLSFSLQPHCSVLIDCKIWGFHLWPGVSDWLLGTSFFFHRYFVLLDRCYTSINPHPSNSTFFNLFVS